MKSRKKRKEKMNKMLLLQCPKCKNRMKYEGRTVLLGNKKKACVYCGISFKIKDNIIKSE